MWKELLTSFLSQAEHPLIVVLGPTAGGKTSFSLELSQALRGEHVRTAEIVNADSRQLYRGLDIGTAKITPEERGDIPHHLIDVLDPNEELTAARYKEMAEQTIDAVLERGNVPVLVGGSMLYISAVIDGLQFVPQADPALRAQLEKEYEKDGGAALYSRLQEEDPETAASIHPNNKPYLIRALEIIESGDAPASSQKAKATCPYDLLIFGMDWPREDIHKRINERTKQMLRSGWVAEVRDLLAKGCTPDDPAMKSHGYREIAEKLATGEDPDALSHDQELAELIAAKSRQYAKRQMTWWRRDPRIHWVSPDR